MIVLADLNISQPATATTLLKHSEGRAREPVGLTPDSHTEVSCSKACVSTS